MPRLPEPGKDVGVWGDLLNSFLSVEHNANGSLKRGDDITDAKSNADIAVQSVSNMNSLLSVEHNADGTLKRGNDITDAKNKADIAIQAVNNILLYGVQRGTTASQTTAIQAALDSAPGEAFYFPAGQYRLDSTLHVTAGNILIFAPGARLYAGAAMSVLLNYDNGASAAANFAADKGIFGSGILDGNLLADNVLVVASVLRFPIEGLTIINPLRRGIWTKTLGAEILARNIRIHNTGTTNSHSILTISTNNESASVVATAGTFSAADIGFPIIAAGVRTGTVIQEVADSTHATLSTSASATASGVPAALITSVGVDANMGDCHWDDVIIRDFTVGIWDKASNLWHKIHPWIGTTSQITARYQYSVAFWVGGDSKFVLSTADTYRYSYRTGSTGGWARMRLSMARGACNNGQLTPALAASYPGVMLDLQDQGNVISVAGSWQGHNVTPHAFVAGNSKTLIARDNLDTQAGSVAGIGTYHRGVKMGISTFAGTLFGTTSGSVTLTTNDCRMEVRDGFVLYTFVFVGTATANLVGALRVGGLPLPPGATSTSPGMGTVSFAAGPDVNVTIGANGSSAPLVVQLHKMAGGTTTQPSATALAGQPVQVWGQITSPFTYPA